MNLLELTSAYNVLANNGDGIFVHGIRSIENTGKLLFMREGSGSGKVLDPFVVSTMTKMMEQTISSGTGRKAKLIDQQLEKQEQVNPSEMLGLLVLLLI